METVNIYLVYSESKQKGSNWANSLTIQCNTLDELIYELKRCANEKVKNVIIHTIQNGKQQ